MFKTIKLKIITVVISLIIAIILLSVSFVSVVSTESSFKTAFTIVIDAGHGGSDGGCVSPFSDLDENHINLLYAQTLQQLAQSVGFNVVMTRENLNGLYPLHSTNRKKDDMLKRQEIINNSNADLVVSIHMNSFPLQSCRGCQAFYNPQNQASIALANNIQSVFIQNLSNARAAAESGDYFILNCTTKPAVLIECGFLSNQEDEQLLQTEDYRLKICTLILYGIILTYV